jgi:hypothetical protein
MEQTRHGQTSLAVAPPIHSIAQQKLVILTGMSDTADSRLCWYHLTPDRFVMGLLAVEGLLWLSGRFPGLAKGWPVVIALATLAVAVLLMLVWFAVALIFRRRVQFSIRSLFVLMLTVAAAFGWLVAEMKAAREQKDAVEEMRKLGWDVYYDWELDLGRGPEAPQPAWLRNLLGNDFFVHAQFARCGANGEDADAGLAHLKALTKLEVLDLSGAKITDAGLAHLKGLTQIQKLCLARAQVADASLAHLEGLTELQLLSLDDTKVTDAGLARLTSLTKLEWLSLHRTKTTDAGLRHLEGFTQLQWLWLDNTQVTDNGLRHLARLKQLRELYVDGTHVTHEGAEMLRQALPNCKIQHVD